MSMVDVASPDLVEVSESGTDIAGLGRGDVVNFVSAFLVTAANRERMRVHKTSFDSPFLQRPVGSRKEFDVNTGIIGLGEEIMHYEKGLHENGKVVTADKIERFYYPEDIKFLDRLAARVVLGAMLTVGHRGLGAHLLNPENNQEKHRVASRVRGYVAGLLGVTDPDMVGVERRSKEADYDMEKLSKFNSDIATGVGRARSLWKKQDGKRVQIQREINAELKNRVMPRVPEEGIDLVGVSSGASGSQTEKRVGLFNPHHLQDINFALVEQLAEAMGF